MKSNKLNLGLLFALAFFMSLSAGLVYATVFTDTYDTNTPQGSDNPAEADDRMREIKAGVQERENVDHYWPLTGTEVSDADTGEHRKITFHEPIATPTNVADKGFVYTKDSAGSKAELTWLDEDGNEFQITNAGGYNGGTMTGNVSITGTLDVDTSITLATGASPTEFSTDTTLGGESDTAIPTEKAVKTYVTSQVPLSIGGITQSIGETSLGGLDIKWGFKSIAANTTSAVTFTSEGLAAFPAALLNLQATYVGTKTTIEHSLAIGMTSRLAFTLTNGDDESRTISWFAVGR